MIKQPDNDCITSTLAATPRSACTASTTPLAGASSSLVNQVIKNTAGFALLPQEQACGGIDNIVIERVLSSTETLTSAKLASAHGTMGPDHLNNVEQVTATGPAGTSE